MDIIIFWKGSKMEKIKGMKMNNNLRILFIGFVLFTFMSVPIIWAKGGKDINGLKQENYDANGWYQKADGTWVQNPNGAIFEIKEEYSQAAGISASVPVGGYIVSAQQTNTGANRFTNENPGAHGTAAEQANTIDDLLHGRIARIVGDDNAKDGPDRIVNNIRIQTKYYKSYQESVDSCFSIDGAGKYQFRYYNLDGKPMQIEVPKDQYANAIKQMEDRIRDGSVRGVSNPAEAKNIIRKGNITYKQSVNITKAGNIDSLLYDAKTGVVSCGFAFGLSALVDYWLAKRIGVDTDVALRGAIVTGLKVGGVAFASSVLAGQLTKAGLNPFTISTKVNPGPGSKNNIPGPLGQQSFEKLFRGNMIYAITTVVILTGVDTVNLFNGRISGSQLFKNLLSNTGAAVGAAAGGAAGAQAGAAVGSMVAPGPGTVIGTAVGGIGGGVVGGIAGKFVVHTTAGIFIEDDANKMVEIIRGQFTFLLNSYICTITEAEQAVSVLKTKLYGDTLKDMFESKNRTVFARNLLIPIFEDIASSRSYIALPDEEHIVAALNAVLEEVIE